MIFKKGLVQPHSLGSSNPMVWGSRRWYWIFRVYQFCNQDSKLCAASNDFHIVVTDFQVIILRCSIMTVVFSCLRERGQLWIKATGLQ